MAKRVIFILDYDGCMDLLFLKSLCFMEIREDDRYYAIYKAQRRAILDFLKALAESSETTPEVLVGSSRQSGKINAEIEDAQDNGDCFKNYQNLCKKQGWLLNPFLLCDKYRKCSPGTSMKEPLSSSFEWSKLKSNDQKLNEWDPTKIDLVASQLEHLSKKYPYDELVIYFVDDNPKGLITNLQRHFTEKCSTFPANITLQFIEMNHYAVRKSLEPEIKDTEIPIADIEKRVYDKMFELIKIMRSITGTAITKAEERTQLWNNIYDIASLFSSYALFQPTTLSDVDDKLFPRDEDIPDISYDASF